MEDLVQPDRLRARILLWAEEEIRLDALPPKSGGVLEALLYRGELPRGEVMPRARHQRSPCPPHRRRAYGERRARIRELARAASACLPGRLGLALDAGSVSGENRKLTAVIAYEFLVQARRIRPSIRSLR